MISFRIAEYLRGFAADVQLILRHKWIWNYYCRATDGTAGKQDRGEEAVLNWTVDSVRKRNLIARYDYVVGKLGSNIDPSLLRGIECRYRKHDRVLSCDA